jgi:hypothetical protein
MVEHSAVNRVVVGSSPTGGAKGRAQCAVFFYAQSEFPAAPQRAIESDFDRCSAAQRSDGARDELFETNPQLSKKATWRGNLQDDAITPCKSISAPRQTPRRQATPRK